MLLVYSQSVGSRFASESVRRYHQCNTRMPWACCWTLHEHHGSSGRNVRMSILCVIAKLLPQCLDGQRCVLIISPRFTRLSPISADVCWPKSLSCKHPRWPLAAHEAKLEGRVLGFRSNHNGIAFFASSFLAMIRSRLLVMIRLCKTTLCFMSSILMAQTAGDLAVSACY